MRARCARGATHSAHQHHPRLRTIAVTCSAPAHQPQHQQSDANLVLCILRVNHQPRERMAPCVCCWHGQRHGSQCKRCRAIRRQDNIQLRVLSHQGSNGTRLPRQPGKIARPIKGDLGQCPIRIKEITNTTQGRSALSTTSHQAKTSARATATARLF